MHNHIDIFALFLVLIWAVSLDRDEFLSDMIVIDWIDLIIISFESAD